MMQLRRICWSRSQSAVRPSQGSGRSVQENLDSGWSDLWDLQQPGTRSIKLGGHIEVGGATSQERRGGGGGLKLFFSTWHQKRAWHSAGVVTSVSLRRFNQIWLFTNIHCWCHCRPPVQRCVLSSFMMKGELMSGWTVSMHTTDRWNRYTETAETDSNPHQSKPPHDVCVIVLFPWDLEKLTSKEIKLSWTPFFSMQVDLLWVWFRLCLFHTNVSSLETHRYTHRYTHGTHMVHTPTVSQLLWRDWQIVPNRGAAEGKGVWRCEDEWIRG